ncbi:MAG: hypothetical protein F4X35_06875 [Alphaproteobacteria bacterium]|nr:hypothetical protein [Alphaproteobacteria bacterium]MYE59285.1 hypothetical protein [Alphaproteobacteria bacterium]
MAIWIQAIAAVATILVAILLYNLEQNLEEKRLLTQENNAQQEERRASVSRSVALYRDFTTSNAVQLLRQISHRINHELWKQGEAKLKYNAVTIFNQPKFQQESQRIRNGLAEILQRVKVVYRCGKFEAKYERKAIPGEPLCDQDTIFVLLGALLSEIHATFRPVIYCDQFFKERYLERDEVSGHISMFEALIKDHTIRDFARKGVEWKVFKTKNKREEALEDGTTKKGDANWSILRVPRDRCELYGNNSI